MSSPLSGKRLLVVAGDPTLAALVAGAVSRLGAEVRRVRSGRAAIEALVRSPPDVAILDLPLEDVRGSEILSSLGAAGVPAIAVSGVFRGARAAEEVRRLGAADFFEKPFAVDALASSVARAVGVRAPALEEEAVDDVTGSRLLSPEEVPDGISSAAPIPALETDQPIPGGERPQGGFYTPLPETRRSRPPPVDGPPPARGDLSRTAVPRLLVAIHEGQATGALTVQRGPVRKIVVVEAGAAVYAASNVAAERFGAICVRRGIVAQPPLDALRAHRPGVRTADLLVEAGLLSPEKRTELVAGQIRAIVWSTFEWRDGAYDFQLGRPPPNRVPVALAMGDLVLEGMMRASSLPRLQAELPADAHLAPAPDPAFELFALGLRPREARLLTLADGTKSVADLVRLSDMEERDAWAFLQACRIMRVLDEVERVLASTRRIGFM